MAYYLDMTVTGGRSGGCGEGTLGGVRMVSPTRLLGTYMAPMYMPSGPCLRDPLPVPRNINRPQIRRLRAPVRVAREGDREVHQGQ